MNGIQAQMFDCPQFSGTTGYGMMGGGGYWGLTGIIFMVLFWAALILAVIWLYKQVRGEAAGMKGETALDVLKKRYAAGEITKDQFNEMKKEIG